MNNQQLEAAAPDEWELIYRLEQLVAEEAFERAVASGWLTLDCDQPLYVGNFMYMGRAEGQDLFKDSRTRQYLPRMRLPIAGAKRTVHQRPIRPFKARDIEQYIERVARVTFCVRAERMDYQLFYRATQLKGALSAHTKQQAWAFQGLAGRFL